MKYIAHDEFNDPIFENNSLKILEGNFAIQQILKEVLLNQLGGDKIRINFGVDYLSALNNPNYDLSKLESQIHDTLLNTGIVKKIYSINLTKNERAINSNISLQTIKDEDVIIEI